MNNKNYEIKKYPIQTQNGKIYGLLYIPEKIKNAPLIIISHGFTGTLEDNLDYAEFFVKLDYLVYIFDFKGGSIESKSAGKMTEMSVMTEVKDLEDIIENLKDNPYVNQKEIILIGKSQGGVVSAITAARHPTEIKALVLIYPAFIIHDDARKFLKDYSKETLPETYEVFGQTLGKIYAEDVWDYDVYKEIGKFKGPVLIIHGDYDEVVSDEYSKKAHRVYKNSDTYIIHGAQHGFGEEYTPLALELIESFLKARKI